jgi:hypothetical protein
MPVPAHGNRRIYHPLSSIGSFARPIVSILFPTVGTATREFLLESHLYPHNIVEESALRDDESLTQRQ